MFCANERKVERHFCSRTSYWIVLFLESRLRAAYNRFGVRILCAGSGFINSCDEKNGAIERTVIKSPSVSFRLSVYLSIWPVCWAQTASNKWKKCTKWTATLQPSCGDDVELHANHAKRHQSRSPEWVASSRSIRTKKTAAPPSIKRIVRLRTIGAATGRRNNERRRTAVATAVAARPATSTTGTKFSVEEIEMWLRLLCAAIQRHDQFQALPVWSMTNWQQKRCAATVAVTLWHSCVKSSEVCRFRGTGNATVRVAPQNECYHFRFTCNVYFHFTFFVCSLQKSKSRWSRRTRRRNYAAARN